MKEITVYSFDVFDTIITRATALPAGVFVIMHDKLSDSEYQDIPCFIRNNFTHLRINAEISTGIDKKFSKGNNQVNINDIYNYISYAASLTAQQIKRLVELEKSIEYSCSVPILENIITIKKLLYDKKRVIFISDMYLDSKFIKSLICKHVPEFIDIPLYVSCEQGANKPSGELFSKVLHNEGIKSDEIEHIGDNYDADVKGAEKIGIQGRLFKFEPLTSWEIGIIETGYYNAVIQLAVGTARNARLGSHMSLSGIMGVSYAAPLLFQYVWHLLKKCVKKGIRLIAFITRDGIVLKHIADSIISSTDDEKLMSLQTKIIYGSRLVWYTDEESKMKIASDYLLQELPDDSGSLPKFALVDINGSGKTMSHIAMLLHNHLNEPFDAFYMMRSLSITSTHHEGYILNCFLSYNTDFTEVLCRAPIGKTVGYTFENKKIIPILDEYNPLFDGFDYDEYIKGISIFCSEFTKICQELYIEPESLLLSDSFITYAISKPQNELIAFWGQMYTATYVEESDIIPFAVRPSTGELRDMYLLRAKGSKPFDYARSLRPEHYNLFYTENDLRKIEFYKKNYNSIIGKIARCIFPKPHMRVNYDIIKIAEKLQAIAAKRVIIYGAGEAGMIIKTGLIYLGFEIVLTVDTNYINLDGIDNPEHILHKTYDMVIIAITNINSCMDVKAFLEGLGVPKSKILMLPTIIYK